MVVRTRRSSEDPTPEATRSPGPALLPGQPRRLCLPGTTRPPPPRRNAGSRDLRRRHAEPARVSPALPRPSPGRAPPLPRPQAPQVTGAAASDPVRPPPWTGPRPRRALARAAPSPPPPPPYLVRTTSPPGPAHAGRRVTRGPAAPGPARSVRLRLLLPLFHAGPEVVGDGRTRDGVR